MVKHFEAKLLGSSDTAHRQTIQFLNSVVQQTAEQLLREPRFQLELEQGPFRAGDRILALGDSITDDACSWAEMLRAVLDFTSADVEVINAGISGNSILPRLLRGLTCSSRRGQHGSSKCSVQTTFAGTESMCRFG